MVDFTSTAPLLAWMVANTTADRNERIAPPDYICRFIELALSGKRQIFRNIHTRRTRMLARCPDQTFTNCRPAGLQNNVLLILVPEMTQCGKDRIRGCLSKAAK
jgi:hypothetical protein